MRKGGKTAFMFLDAEKAFDNVSWTFLMKVLQNMNCGTEFLNWMQSIHTDQQARILINGSLTEKIEITKGTQQGCPISFAAIIYSGNGSTGYQN